MGKTRGLTQTRDKGKKGQAKVKLAKASKRETTPLVKTSDIKKLKLTKHRLDKIFALDSDDDEVENGDEDGGENEGEDGGENEGEEDANGEGLDAGDGEDEGGINARPFLRLLGALEAKNR